MGVVMTRAIRTLVTRRARRDETPVAVVWYDDRYHGRCGDLVDASADGAFIAVAPDDARPPVEGSHVRFEAFVGDEGYAVEGTVRWTGRHPFDGREGFGIAFDAESAYVAEALAYRLTDPQRPSGVFRR